MTTHNTTTKNLDQETKKIPSLSTGMVQMISPILKSLHVLLHRMLLVDNSMLQLELWKEVGCYHSRVFFHFYFSRFVFDGCPCQPTACHGLENNKPLCDCHVRLHIRLSI